MKKVFFLIGLSILLLLPVSAAASIGVDIDGEVYELDPPPVQEDEHILMPMRAFYETLGAEVSWEEDTKTAVGTLNDKVARIPIGSDSPAVNDSEISIDVPVKLIDNYTYVHIDFFNEALEYDVSWDEEVNTIFVKDVFEEPEPEPEPVEREIDPIVTSAWLEENLELEDLVILDIRGEEDYEEGHIPGAVNMPAGAFWVDDELAMMVPEETALFDTIGSAGIAEDSKVVVVGELPGEGEPPYSLAQMTRVAATLIYAGVDDVAILDGGYEAWLEEERPTTTDVTEADDVTYEGEVREGMFVSREYVEGRIGESVIVDNRDADVYFGVTIEPFADKAGHIPTAKSLPTPWMWNKDWSYLDAETLNEIADGVIGEDPGEVIVYCGVGGYASTGWYVLTQVLEYDNVRFYDGSAQEWVLTNDMVRFTWE